MKAGWEVKTLGDAFQTVTGSTPPKARKDYYGNDVPLVKPPELLDNLVSDAVDGLTSEGSKVARIAPAGSILVSCIGNLGKIGLAARDLAFNQQINAIFPNNTKAISEFMFYQVLSPQFKSQIEALATGTTVPIVNKSRFNSITVNLPPLEEQKRIVSILDEAFEGLDRARENAEANLKSARELFENTIENELAALPDGSQCELDAHIDLLSGFAFKSKAYSEDPKDMRLMRGDNIIPGKVRWEKAKYWPSSDLGDYERYILCANDLLIAMDRTWIKSGIKYALLKPDDVPCLLVQRVARLRSRPTISHAFLELLIGSKAFEHYVLSIQTGLGVPHISAQQIRDFPTKVPSPQTQHIIVTKMQSLRSQCERLRTDYIGQLQDISDLRQSLLQKAFAGELT